MNSGPRKPWWENMMITAKHPQDVKAKNNIHTLSNNTNYNLPVTNMTYDYSEGISICITAYNVQDIIEKRLDSISNQSWFGTHENWEIIVGINGCEKTLEKMKSIIRKYRNLKVLMFKHNDTDIVFNTIVKESKYDWILKHDINEMMSFDNVENIMNEKEASDKLIKNVEIDFNKKTCDYSVIKNYDDTIKGIISLTSWKARINYAYDTIKSFLDKTNGFRVVLVLSEEEFPQKENELPKNILSLLSDRFELLWVYKNYRAFKKVLFTMKKYPDLPVISADDDMLCLADYPSIMYDKWCANKKAFVSNIGLEPKHFGWNHNSDVRHTSGCSTLYPPSVFGDYGISCITSEILNMYEDDVYYTALKCFLGLHEYIIIPEITSMYKLTDANYNVSPLHNLYAHQTGEIKYKIFEYTKKNIQNHILSNCTVLCANFNVSELTCCMIESIRKQLGFNIHVTVLDNSTANPWNNSITDNVDVIDNTNFRYTKNYNEPSLNHGYSIDYALKHIKKEWAIICDCDILFLHKIKGLFQILPKDFDICGEIGHDAMPKDRLFPYLCIINNKKLNDLKIDFCDEQTDLKQGFDTGYSLLVNAKKQNLNIKNIKLSDYIVHLKGACLRNKDYKSWLNQYKDLFEINTNKHVILQIQGNLGNQMFQLAFALTYANRSKRKLWIKKPYNWKLNARIVNLLGIPLWEKEIPNNCIHLNDDKEHKFINFKTDYQNDIVVINGYFESEKYFDKNLIRKKFDFSSLITDDLKSKYRIDSNTVALSVRRGDFLNLTNGFFVPAKNFYNDMIKKYVANNEKLLVSSDDIEWCKQNIEYDNCVYLEETAEVNMMLLSLCNTHLNSSSTFSWWSSWINEKTDSKIVMPNTRFKLLEKQKNDNELYIPSRWIRHNIEIPGFYETNNVNDVNHNKQETHYDSNGNNVEIITVVYNTPDLLELLLSSINRYNSQNFHVRIIDGSDKEELIVADMQIVSKYNNCEIEQLKYNIHHGPGMDYAISNSKYDYLLICDSDDEIRCDLAESVNNMLSFNKVFTGFNEEVNRNGYNVNFKNISYVHPRFMLVKKDEYMKLKQLGVGFIKHGAPCINTMVYIHDNKLEADYLGILDNNLKSKYFIEHQCGTSGRFGMNL